MVFLKKKLMNDGYHLEEEIANDAYRTMTSFEFIFITHLNKEPIKITDMLCQASRCNPYDVSHA